MGPGDVALLLVLGTAARAPATLADLVAAARDVAPRDWQPTADTIAAAARRALALGYADEQQGGADVALATTPAGCDHMIRLLRKPLPTGPDGFVRTCMSAKAGFLDHLPAPERGEHAAELVVLYRETIAAACRLRTAVAGALPGDLAGECLRLESELAWLNAGAAWQPMRRAAE